MSKLVIEERQVVIPGDTLAEGMDFLPGKGAFREGDNIISSRLGITNVSGRIVNVNCAYEASLSMKEATADFIERGSSLSDYFGIGEIILTSISNVTKEGNIDLTMKAPGLRKLHGGKIIEITPSKIPRVVGKQGSMISLIKDKTGCSIFAGQNGRIWIRGANPEAEKLATEAIQLINDKAHTSGLTERVGAFLEQHALEMQK